MNIQTRILLAGLVLGAPTFAQSAAPMAGQKDAAYQLYPAGKVLGLKVMNDSQKSVGEIGDILVDPHTGELRYAVLDVGGFLGVGEDHRVVPLSYIAFTPDEKNVDKCHASTTLTEQQVKAAPHVKTSTRVDPDLDKRIESSFGKNDDWAYTGKGAPSFAWLSDMDGVQLKDSTGTEVGKVQDLVIAPANACVAYVVVDTVRDAGDKDVALPWGRIDYSYDADNKLMATTPIAIARFRSAPEYDSKDWKRMAGTPWVKEINTYYESDPFWKTTRFASARKQPAPQKP